MAKKITFLGAGSTIFLKNVLGDILLSPNMHDCTVALYDIDKTRLQDSYLIAEALNSTLASSKATILRFNGPKERKQALRGADFIVNTVQIGGYNPATIADFEIPKKYGLRQTIGDTIGIGGIFRGLRTAPFIIEIGKEIDEVCPTALLLNYTNPMAIVTGLLQRVSNVQSIGLCHSVQVCAPHLLEELDMEATDLNWEIAGINHMAWLLAIRDGEKDLYPEIRQRAFIKNQKALKTATPHADMVRFEMMKHFGYYTTESSEHNAEYTPYWINPNHPELISSYGIPLDEYPRRCESQIKEWTEQREMLLAQKSLEHTESKEYAGSIIQARITGKHVVIHGNIRNNGYITNLPQEAIVEVPCLIDRYGIHGVHIGTLPVQCAALNRTNINTQLLTIEAALTKRMEYVYQAALLDPHTAAVLPIDSIIRLCDELMEAHAQWLPKYIR